MRTFSSVAALMLALTLTAAPCVAGGFRGDSNQDNPQGGVGPGVFEGNDTGGIIAWSPEVDLIYHDIAAAHCACWNKVPEITSVHRWYGDYIGFRCHFPRGYDPRKWEVYGPPLGVMN
jgi:hypothetical protein